MIGQVDPARLAPQQRAGLIYAQARAELSSRLWQAALGTGDGGGGEMAVERSSADVSLESLLTMLADDAAKSAPTPLRTAETWQAMPAPEAAPVHAAPERPSAPATGLGVNAPYQDKLNAAAARTGIPATALAAIVHAEAAKGPGGRWLVYSRNPRSSAAGLGQFLSSTWQGEAERSGSWLNGVARARGWLGEGGKILPAARASLLALRYDPDASIQAIADYAKANLDTLKRAGVSVGDSVESIAQAAYFGHHLGVGDAIRFLKGGIDPARARLLLNAQVGSSNASQRIAAAGSASGAHRAWLLDYVGRNIRPQRFEAAFSTG